MGEMTVANTILAQLGGRRFMAMTGAKNFVGTPDSLIFMLPARFAKDGINKVVVTLTPMDVYNVDFYKVSRSATRFDPPVSSHEDIYAENLRGLFSRVTGLAVTL